MFKKAMIGALLLGATQLTLVAPATAATEVFWGIWPVEVEPGGDLAIETKSAQGGCTPATPATSAGFAAPIDWKAAGMWGGHRGYGKAVTTPGKYTANFTCNDGRKGETLTFTVIGTPPGSTTPKPTTSTKPATPTKSKPAPATPTKAKPAPAKPKPQVAVKPVGAPQTGGGGFAPMAWDW
ncbi:hypothetical protein [Amycolatopsis sp. TNS106]|uniref:hypothetical protein n=1 Tax=Amycolatopsis sp. TNS106 TaxID=2861750 RepID=UPI001C559F4B|nr:hypothetical protein [Amycolatopsis sp. TNS106]QXV61713.1 hypothetical protein CVV72_35110 [Amycolatopsis sp. TNS106]